QLARPRAENSGLEPVGGGSGTGTNLLSSWGTTAAQRHLQNPRAVLCRASKLELGTEATAFNRLGIALQHLELRLSAVAPESDIESLFADTKVGHRQVGQPRRQQWIDAQLSPWGVRLKTQHRLHQCEDRACCPGLRYVGPKILDREICFIALGRRIELRQLVEHEVACCAADITGDPCRLSPKAIALEPQCNGRIVVRPDRSGLVVVRIERRVKG